MTDRNHLQSENGVRPAEGDVESFEAMLADPDCMVHPKRQRTRALRVAQLLESLGAEKVAIFGHPDEIEDHGFATMAVAAMFGGRRIDINVPWIGDVYHVMFLLNYNSRTLGRWARMRKLAKRFATKPGLRLEDYAS